MTGFCAKNFPPCEVCSCNLRLFQFPAAVSNQQWWAALAIAAATLGNASWKSVAVSRGHLDRGWTSWAITPILHIGSGALLCDPLGHALHRAGPEQALAELRLHLLPWPCAGPLFCASALSRPCCTCSGPEQAWLQLRCSGLVLALADHLCEDRAQHYKFDILVFYFLAYVDLDRLLP